MCHVQPHFTFSESAVCFGLLVKCFDCRKVTCQANFLNYTYQNFT